MIPLLSVIGLRVTMRVSSGGKRMTLFIRERYRAADCYWLRFLSDFHPFFAQ